MIISRTPTRVSLLGGSTDYREFYLKNGGIVIGGAINLYSYLSVRSLLPFHDFKSRVVYSEIETVQSNKEIKHRAIRAVLEHLQIEDGVEIFHSSDLPSRSGTGSSSSFIVGLLHALSSLKGNHLFAHELLRRSLEIEQESMGECVGSQDHCFASYGGFNVIRFRKTGEINVSPVEIGGAALRNLEAHLLLLHTGISRSASDVARSYVSTLGERSEPWELLRLAEQGIDAVYKNDYERLGKLIDQSWMIKRGLSPEVSSKYIDDLYLAGRVCGAWGGKLIGAGKGGCLVFVAPPEKHRNIVAELKLVPIPFQFDHDGSRVIFMDRKSC